MLPETTEGRVGFVHPYTGVARRRRVEHEDSAARFRLQRARREGENAARHGGADAGEVSGGEDHDRRQRELQEHERGVEGLSAVDRQRYGSGARAGLKPFMKPIRGGTDGATLTFRGLPTPNLFTGGSNFHGKLEFNSRRGLEKTTEI